MTSKSNFICFLLFNIIFINILKLQYGVQDNVDCGTDSSKSGGVTTIEFGLVT